MLSRYRYVTPKIVAVTVNIYDKPQKKKKNSENSIIPKDWSLLIQSHNSPKPNTNLSCKDLFQPNCVSQDITGELIEDLFIHLASLYDSYHELIKNDSTCSQLFTDEWNSFLVATAMSKRYLEYIDKTILPQNLVLTINKELDIYSSSAIKKPTQDMVDNYLLY